MRLVGDISQYLKQEKIKLGAEFCNSTQTPRPNYVQNGKVHFKRLGHLNDELEFRRNPILPQLPTFLSKKELLSRLSEQNAQNKHQEQIADNAAEIFDVAEQEYKDYKDAV
uniref:Bm10344 n=1 Tax=Brugia malayi TaxID=6279 RepID=A0A0J9XX41_BRUMA|nr:Bm10344 [Brugia malayi]